MTNATIEQDHAEAIAYNAAVQEAEEAFETAILSGRFTRTEAGDYMYMGTYNGGAQFKHRITRRYLPLVPTPLPRGRSPRDFREEDCSGVYACDGNVYSDADPGL